GGREGKEGKGHIIILYKGKFAGEEGKDMCCEREGKSVCGRELRRKIGIWRKIGGGETGIEQNPALTLLMRLGKHLFPGWK
ncbi:hypothetical protein, partial [Bacteroides sp.]|uniref:hypothetical protein n=1 Tax=Bacteroides sp. TaxID=29523 RepID=UPI002A800F78